MGDDWFKRGGSLDLETGHMTLWGQSSPEDEGIRISWNADGSEVHLTDQNFPKGDPRRHPFGR